MNDYYRESSGSPEVSTTHEAAVERMVTRMAALFRERVGEFLADVLDDLAPAYVPPIHRDASDDENDEVFADALNEFENQLVAAVTHTRGEAA